RVTYARAEQAEQAYAARVAGVKRRKFVEVGPSEILGPSPARAGSVLALDALFAAGDEHVVDEVLACTSERKLAAIAAAGPNDARPGMRRALLAYVDDGCDRPHHRVLVKGILKQAERAGDDELMAHLLVAFDRLSRRYAVKRRERAPGTGWRDRTVLV